ncbi:MAG: outer membrane lipoprotein-sorting protein [Verrucomicrobia bacterium]|nr:outer membrane lipoprotein-sorting protein [Verrucomicrobiota bacterium]
MRAEAYDKKGELIKIFTVGGIKEINGEKVISRFDMENLQSRFFSRIEFNE